MFRQMKRKLSKAARAAMASGGRKASHKDKSNAGKSGFKAMLRVAAREILAEAKEA